MSHHRSGPGAHTAAAFEDFDNQCRNKIRFTSKRQSNGKLRAVRQRNPGLFVQVMSSYKCAICHGWHFGRTPAHLRES